MGVDQTYKLNIRKIGENASIHGVRQLSLTYHHSKFVFFGWICIIFVAFATICYQITTLMSLILTYPSSVAVSVTLEHTVFPTVTACNLGVYKKSVAETIDTFVQMGQSLTSVSSGQRSKREVTTDANDSAFAVERQIVTSNLGKRRPKRQTSLCATGCTIVGDFCYINFPTAMNNPAAQSSCANAGGKLPFFSTMAQYNSYNAYQWSIFSTEYIWLGFWNFSPHNATNPGVWRDSNGTGSPLNFSYWLSTYPIGGRGCAANCKPSYQCWVDFTCTNQYKVLCMCQCPTTIANGIVISPSVPTINYTAQIQCNSGYQLVGGPNLTCIISSGGMSWDLPSPSCVAITTKTTTDSTTTTTPTTPTSTTTLSTSTTDGCVIPPFNISARIPGCCPFVSGTTPIQCGNGTCLSYTVVKNNCFCECDDCIDEECLPPLIKCGNCSLCVSPTIGCPTTTTSTTSTSTTSTFTPATSTSTTTTTPTTTTSNTDTTTTTTPTTTSSTTTTFLTTTTSTTDATTTVATTALPTVETATVEVASLIANVSTAEFTASLDLTAKNGTVDNIAAASQLNIAMEVVLSSLPQAELKQLGFQRNEFVTACLFSGIPCNNDERLTLVQIPEFMNCYAFNHRDQTNLVTFKRPGEKFGLSMAFNIQSDEYINTVSTSGVQLFVRDQLDPILPGSMGSIYSPGLLYYIIISKRIESQLSVTGRSCVASTKENSFNLFKNDNYFTESCLRSYLQLKIINNCGCGSTKYPLPNDNSQFCNLTTVKCVSNYLTSYGAKLNEEAKIACPPACRSVSFDLTTSFATVCPEVLINARDIVITINVSICFQQSLLDHLNITKTSYMKNVVMVKLFFTTGTVMVYTEALNFDVMSVLANMGGSLGCIAGISMISLVELFFIIAEVVKILKFKCQHRQMQF